MSKITTTIESMLEYFKKRGEQEADAYKAICNNEIAIFRPMVELYIQGYKAGRRDEKAALSAEKEQANDLLSPDKQGGKE
jgi:hypothetical protein